MPSILTNRQRLRLVDGADVTFAYSSRALCRSCGFREVGVYEKHRKLDGKWLDTVIVERLIPENQD